MYRQLNLAEVGQEAKSYLSIAISPKSSIAISTSSAGYPKGLLRVRQVVAEVTRHVAGLPTWAG